MAEEENKTKTRRFMEEAFNKGNMNVIDELLAPNFVDHNPFPGYPPGLEGIRQGIAELRKGFPDLRFSIDDLLADGDKVVIRSTMTGTNKGAFMGTPATGKQIKVAAIDIVRITGGKAVEHWGITQDLEMMQQLGLVPKM